MKKLTQTKFCIFPFMLWLLVTPLIVKVKFYENPLIECSWYTNAAILSDFFLYYKSIFVTSIGFFMLIVLFWQIGKMNKKDFSFTSETRIFIPIFIYLALAILSSSFSEYGYFCIHGMPDQFETIWNLIAYVISLLYCYYLVMYQNLEKSMLGIIFFGVCFVGLICMLQYFKIDIYRMIYSKEGYSFTFDEGTVYGPFYNTNYVGYYALLFLPIFILFILFYKGWKVKLASVVLTISLLISMIGAKSSTAIIAFGGVNIFLLIFLLLKNINKKRNFWISICVISGICICVTIAVIPRIRSSMLASNTEQTNLENIFTHDDCVEIDYKGEKLFIGMQLNGSRMSFELLDQNQSEVDWEYMDSDDGYTCYLISDKRFGDITIAPALFSEEPSIYGFVVTIDGKEWCFSNQMTEDGTYYYFSGVGKLTKLTAENVSDDFEPLKNKSSLASGRGYIWNKTIAILKNFLFLGSGADTFALVFPNQDFVDRYNNGYDNMIITKPHSLYLQIAVQTGGLSLACFLMFYIWYFISSLRIYFKQHLNDPITTTGFAIMLGTLGYMISGLANDSTITVAPLYWAMLGMGIGINHKIKSKMSHAS